MSTGSTRYQEILRNKKGIVHSKTTAPALEFIQFMNSQPKDYIHKGSNFISMIKNGFMVRYSKWSNKMYDITNSDGTLMFIIEKEKSPVEPKFGTFKADDKFEDVIKTFLREKKLLRVLQEYGYEEDENEIQL